MTDHTQAAEALGTQHGTAAGSWAVDGNTTPDTLRAILRGIEEGDPAILDTLPLTPNLSGEWADEPGGPAIYVEILASSGGTLSDEDAQGDPAGWDDFSEILDAYEAAYQQASQDEIQRACRAMLPETEA